MLEDWLINPRVDKHDCLMFDDSIGKEWTIGKSTELFYNLVDSITESTAVSAKEDAGVPDRGQIGYGD